MGDSLDDNNISKQANNVQQTDNQNATTGRDGIIEHKICGIKSNGYSCFINATIQMLFNIREFVEFLFRLRPKTSSATFTLQYVYCCLHSNIDANYSSLISRRLKCIAKNLHDSSEFLDTLLNDMSKQIQLITDDELKLSLEQQFLSLVSFNGYQDVLCIESHNKTKQPTRINVQGRIMHLPTKKNATLADCMVNLKSDVTNWRCQIACSNNITKFCKVKYEPISIQRLPDICFFCFDRFNVNANTKKIRKCNNPVTFPEEFTFDITKDDPNILRLVAVQGLLSFS